MQSIGERKFAVRTRSGGDVTDALRYKLRARVYLCASVARTDRNQGVELATEQTLTWLRGRLVIVGFGSVAQGTLPLILRHIDIDRERISILTADESGREVARQCGVRDFRCEALTADNYRERLASVLGKGDFLLNLSVDVSSVALIELCHQSGALYLDSCIEPWVGGHLDVTRPAGERTNYWLREQALAVNLGSWPQRPTAVVTHGVNPGLISHFTKHALLDMARATGADVRVPNTREQWARLAMQLQIKAIHVAECDTQMCASPKRPGEFVNTWSAEAFMGEGTQPAELGWGSHERQLPAGGHEHTVGCRAAIYLERPGIATRVRSWTPLRGPYHGFLVTHAESISIANFLTLFEGAKIAYRPTVHYAYYPCGDAVLSIDEYRGRNYRLQEHRRLLREEITEGMDELGILLCGNPRGVYWYGSRLDIASARQLAPYNNATTLQTAAGVLAGMIWAIENNQCGVVEPDTMDYERVVQIARPYLGTMIGVWGDWTPVQGRQRLFAEAVDFEDPWQFSNVLVR